MSGMRGSQAPKAIGCRKNTAMMSRASVDALRLPGAMLSLLSVGIGRLGLTIHAPLMSRFAARQ